MEKTLSSEFGFDSHLLTSMNFLWDENSDELEKFIQKEILKLCKLFDIQIPSSWDTSKKQEKEAYLTTLVMETLVSAEESSPAEPEEPDFNLFLEEQRRKKDRLIQAAQCKLRKSKKKQNLRRMITHHLIIKQLSREPEKILDFSH